MLLFSWSTNKFHLANQINLADNNLYIIRTDSHEIRLNPAWDEHARNYIPCQLGFYLGYLRGKSPPPPNAERPPPPPPQKKKYCPASSPPPPPPPRPKKYCYHYSIWATMSEKSSRPDEVGEHTVTFLKIVSRNAPDCISAHIHFKKFSLGGGGSPRIPLGCSSPSAAQDFSPTW